MKTQFFNFWQNEVCITSKVIQGYKRQPFFQYILFCLCYWLIEETNVAQNYERTKTILDFYKNDIRLVQNQNLTWTKTTIDQNIKFNIRCFTFVHLSEMVAHSARPKTNIWRSAIG